MSIPLGDFKNLCFFTERHCGVWTRESGGSRAYTIDQFRHIKLQPKTIDLSTRLRGITTEFVGFIPRILMLRSIILAIDG